MTLFVGFNLAHRSLRAHRARTILTILGVVIGVFIVSLVLIVSAGLHRSIADQTDKLNSNLVVVRSAGDSTTGMEAFSPLRIANATTLTALDFDRTAKAAGSGNVAPMMFLGGSASSGSKSFDNITTVATNENLPNVLGMNLQSGAWFSDKEADRAWVVLGSKLASGLLDTNQAMGQHVTIKGKTFTVVGILEGSDRPISLAGVDVDKAAFISMDNGVVFTGGTKQIGQIVVKTKDGQTAAMVRSVTSTLKVAHSDDTEFVVRRAGDIAGSMAGWLTTLTTVALIFAGISLLVGGIGIMNIMLVSVAERTREIGIRKAVGATKRQILEQFLLEALIMTLVGGIIGLSFAYGASYLINLQFSLPMVFSWWIFAIGLGVPIAVGLLFGLWPAIRAARQDPIVALRQYQ